MTQPLNICAFSRVNFWQGIRGGMDFHGRMLSEGLVKRGHRVTMISSKHPEGVLREHRNGVDIHYLSDTVFGSRRHGWAAKSVQRYRMLHKKVPFDLIWSQSFDAFGFAWGGKIVPSPPMVATLHGCIAQEWKSFFSDTREKMKHPKAFLTGLAGLFYAYFICQRPLLVAADRVICVSPTVTADIGKWFGRRFSAGCRVVENGIDVNFFRPDAGMRARIRQRHGIGKDQILLLSLGRLTYAKGHQMAIQALRLLRNRQMDVYLIIAGDGEYEDDLKSAVRRAGVHDRVLFPGFVRHDTAVGYYNAADVFLMPTLTIEGLPFVLLEAMACGKPVIASAIGGNRTVISDGENGILVDPGRPEILAENVADLLQDRKKVDVLSKSARATVVKKYSVDRMVADTLSIMSSAVTARKRSEVNGKGKG